MKRARTHILQGFKDHGIYQFDSMPARHKLACVALGCSESDAGMMGAIDAADEKVCHGSLTMPCRSLCIPVMGAQGLHRPTAPMLARAALHVHGAKASAVVVVRLQQ